MAFYSALLGWLVDEAHPEAGGYRIANLRGKTVAGKGPQQGPVSAWTTYIATDDADATAKATEANGGTVMMPPFDVMDHGRMTMALDPEGAVFGAWQAGAHTGAQLVNETGTMGWNELWTRDADQAKASTRGCSAMASTSRAMPGYTIWLVDGQMVGGCMTVPPHIPARVPAHWAVYFVHSDVDAAVPM